MIQVNVADKIKSNKIVVLIISLFVYKSTTHVVTLLFPTLDPTYPSPPLHLVPNVAHGCAKGSCVKIVLWNVCPKPLSHIVGF